MELIAKAIPEGWSTANLGDLCGRITTGKLDANAMVPTGDYPFFTCARENYWINTYAFDCEALLVSGNGANVGYVHYYNGRFNAYQRTYVISEFRADVQFLKLFLDHYLQDRIRVEVNAGNTPYITMDTLTEMRVVLPKSLPEQRAIATALSEVDGLIRAQEQLIAKKRDLKQAAMQQLLTAQHRLPGFTGEWVVKRLGGLGCTYGGLTGKTKADFGQGAARYITFLNVMNNVVIDTGKFEAVKVAASENQNSARLGDLFFNGSSETPEELGMCSVLLEDVSGVYLNSFCFGFRLNEGADANGLYLAYFFRSSEGRKLLYALAQGATRHNLSKAALKDIKLPIPPLPEQTAIAEVLSEQDEELAALEARLAKTRALKQGMMQSLLTGRIRLV